MEDHEEVTAEDEAEEEEVAVEMQQLEEVETPLRSRMPQHQLPQLNPSQRRHLKAQAHLEADGTDEGVVELPVEETLQFLLTQDLNGDLVGI